MNSTMLDEFTMADNLRVLQSGRQLRRSESSFLLAGSRVSGVPQNHPLPPPEVSGYHCLMSGGPFVNPNYLDAYSLNDFQLDSYFSRLSLSDPFMQERPSYNSFAAAGGSSGGDSNLIRNNLPISLLSTRLQFSGEDIRRTDIHQMGQIGLQMHPPTYPAIADPSNFDPFSINGNLNHLSDYRNPYSSAGRGLNAAAAGYRPQEHRNGFPYGPTHTRSTPNFLLDSSNSTLPGLRYRTNFSSLEDVRGKIFVMAKDQTGCRFLQNKFDEGKPEDIQMIFSEVKDYICELMTDQFGNYLVQKLFDVCREEQITQLLLKVVHDIWYFKDICIDMHGTRAVQKLLEHLTTAEQKTLVVSAIRRITVQLTKSMNGHHVIMHCLKFFSSEDNKHILNTIADNCLDIAMDKSGCCVLQQCAAHAQGKPRERLLAEISSNALSLADHPYGNYVVQYGLGLRIPEVTARILGQLSGNYVALSTNKYGSNVVEKCLKESDGDQVLKIINEIILSPNFVNVLQDPFGNYVAQSVLSISKGALRNSIIELILLNYALLHSHPHGKRVLARTKGSNRLHL